VKLMMHEDSHLSDQQLLLEVEGELSNHEEQLVQAHLDACWKCRARRQELEQAITDFVHVHQREFDAKLPPAAGPRALLKAQMAQLSAAEPNWPDRPRRLVWAVAIFAVLAIGFFFTRSSMNRPHSLPMVLSIPDSSLTPGAALLVSRGAVCEQANTNNKAVPVALQRKVFDEYGIAGADPRAYEVDYLVTPALGGADDIHNLWPHSHSATIWNAEVKDALEGRLRQMVCDGSLDLTEAQREIAANWIAAYKKYFHTDKPLSEHGGQQIQ
jgi:hypothetical protein